jgi:hypothetical protein
MDMAIEEEPSRPTSPRSATGSPNKRNAISRIWLSDPSPHHSQTFRSIKYILILLLIISLVYLVVIAIIGYKGKTSCSTNADGTPGKPEECPNNDRNYWKDNLLSMAVVVISMAGVIRESPLISVICSVAMMVAILTSLVETISFNLWYIFSPVLPITVISVLLIVYTSIIWSAEFETSPQILEEYKWYLNQLSRQAEEELMNNESLKASAFHSANDMDDNPVASTSKQRNEDLYAKLNFPRSH